MKDATVEEKLLTVDDLRSMDPGRLLLPWEVAQVYRVDPKTVTRWAMDGKMASIKTIGGHRRFKVSVVLADIDNSAD